MRDFTKYNVWELSMELVAKLYDLTYSFPVEEKYGLTSQIRRSGISIPSNISEGCSRSSEKDFKRFVEISIGSCFELKTQLLISQKLSLVEQDQILSLLQNLEKITKKLINLRNKLQ